MHQEADVLQAIIENAAAHLAYLDLEFNYVRANTAYAQGLRLSLEELIGRNHFALYPQSTGRAVFEAVRASGEPARFWTVPGDIPGQPERGVTYWDWAVVPVKNSEGIVTGLIISSTEVT